jgi:hypothetical protein
MSKFERYKIHYHIRRRRENAVVQHHIVICEEDLSACSGELH